MFRSLLWSVPRIGYVEEVAVEEELMFETDDCCFELSVPKCLEEMGCQSSRTRPSILFLILFSSLLFDTLHLS